MIITDWLVKVNKNRDFCDELVRLINRHPNRRARTITRGPTKTTATKIRVIDNAVPLHDGDGRINGWERPLEGICRSLDFYGRRR